MSNPADLNINPQPDTDKNFFNFKAVGLKLNETYAIKFQWIYEDSTLSGWSPGFIVTTSNETAPAVPTATTIPETSTGSIPVTLSTFPTNARRVDVIVTGGIFGLGKVAHSFTTSGVATIAAPAGFYTVQLRSVSPSGVTSTVGNSFTITIADVGETIQAPTNPSGFTASRILAGVQLSWAGTYANGTFTGFEAIKVYAGSSATATGGTYTEVGVLTGNNVKNTITIPVDGTYVKYDQATYLHAAAVNKNGTVGTIQANVANVPLGPGKATDADINDGAVVIEKLASNVLTVGNLKAGDINATSYIRAGTKSTDGLTGARVEISSATITQTGTNVLPGFYIYNSQGTAVLSAPLGGGLSITGSGTFTGSITGASGQFDGDLGASGGNFRVRSGDITALSGTIGGWKINSSVLKSSLVDYPSILLDPVESKIHLRGTAGSSDTGNVIKMDTTSGLRIGPTGSPAFTVAMDGSMTATNATIQKTVGGNTIILDGSSLRAVGSTGSTTLGYDGTITATQAGTWPFSGASFKVSSSDTYTIINPGGFQLHQDSIFGSAAIDYYTYIYNNQVVNYATGMGGIKWANFYVTPSYNFVTSQVWTTLGDEFRMLGVGAFGDQMMGPRLFSGTATSNSTINTDINGRAYANSSLNGDFYFSTA
jgi:hypothetical protein